MITCDATMTYYGIFIVQRNRWQAELAEDGWVLHIQDICLWCDVNGCACGWWLSKSGLSNLVNLYFQSQSWPPSYSI